jgi:hypothetical protein
MGLAFGIFPFGPWLVFVVATVLFEAWAFGRVLRVPFSKALAVSCAANFLTAVFGLYLAEVFFHGFVIIGTRLNPNPFGQTVVLFLGFAIVSAAIEFPFWDTVVKGVNRSVLWPSIAIHLLTVPLGLIILLIPPRPYTGLEMQVRGTRRSTQQDIANQLNDYVKKNKKLPPVHNYPELLQFLSPKLRRFGGPDLWAAELPVAYSRFSTGDQPRRSRMEWNASAKLDPEADDRVWLARMRSDGSAEGIYLQGGYAWYTTHAELLGYR